MAIDNRGGTGLESSVISGDTPCCAASDQIASIVSTLRESKVVAAVARFLPLVYLLQAKRSSGKTFVHGVCNIYWIRNQLWRR